MTDVVSTGPGTASRPPLELSSSLPVVGIGASAGGLESLERLFRTLPDQTGLAFVVVQHLSPDFKSIMDELMSRFTALDVEVAEDGMVVEPDHIYVLPPTCEVELREGRLRLIDKERGHLSFPIDRFMTSLARDVGRRAVAVILSGSGTDGSRGVRDVASSGGLVIAERPGSARFDGMPSAAVETGVVDLVLEPEEIARALMEHARDEVPQLVEVATPELDTVLHLLRDECGVDFSDYKVTTVYRRLQRRLDLKALPGLEAYADLLTTDREEVRALYQDLLIGVTTFFRDPEVWATLQREVVPRLVREAGDRELRFWVAGCATGEEAYSLAMLLTEACRDASRPVRARIFASDVHRASVDRAAQGIYAADRLRNVSPEQLERHFRPVEADRFQVSQELRHLVVFAPHNLLRDAPFTHLDLASCRNLLIYLRPAAQRRALALLHYGLRVGGVLMLGGSESPGDLGADYEPINESVKLYRKRHEGRHFVEVGLSRSGGVSRQPLGSHAPRPAQVDAHTLALYDSLLDRFMPPGFVIAEDRSLVESFGGAEDFLKVKRRRLSTDLIDMVPDPIRVPLAGAIHRAVREGAAIKVAALAWPTAEGEHRVEVAVEPLKLRAARGLRYLLTLTPRGRQAPDPATAASEAAPGELSGERMRALEDELTYTKESLQATIEAVETSNEELQATNEELVASNEELQSTNEELHSVNEELHTVNVEYQRKIAELSELNRDIRHLLESIEVGTIFLDVDLRIRKFTPVAASLFSLVEHDLGRRLSSFKHRLRFEGLDGEIERVLRERSRFATEVQDRDGRWHFLRLLPYEIEGDVTGVVLTITDISVLAAARARAELLSSIVDSSEDAIVSFDEAVTSWNRGAERLYGYAADEMIGQPVARLVPGDRAAELAAALAEVRGHGRVVHLETQRLHRDGHRLEVSSALSPIRATDGAIVGVSTIERDIRPRLEIETQLRESRARYRDLYDRAPDMYLTFDARTGRVEECNETFCEVAGFSKDEAVRFHLRDVYAPPSHAAATRALERLRAGQGVHDLELQLVRKGKPPLDVALSQTPVLDERGEVVRSRSVLRDVAQRKQAEQTLGEALRLRESFLAMVSHELRNPLHAVQAACRVLDSAAVTGDQLASAQRVITRQARHMARMLDDLLDVSRITSNRLELQRAPLDARDALRDAIEATRAMFDERRVPLEVVDLDVPLPMWGDHSRLQQVFTNLLSNAARYSEAGQPVRVEVARRGNELVVEVADHGAGLAPESLERIFGLFAQEEPGIDRQRGGLGIGLSIARWIVDHHGGSLGATSAGVGHGSAFTVRLPLDERARVTTRLANGGEARRVVLVEDQDDAREMMVTLLEIAGHQVSAAATGTEGLELIRRVRPDVALIDIGLPGMNGYEVAEALRRDPADGVLLVALTGYGQASDVERAHAAGFDHHLTKPLSFDKLAGILRTPAHRSPA